MLESLKEQLRMEESDQVLIESARRSNGGDAIKTAFLDTVGTETLGAENDPVIKKLVNTIPEYDDTDGKVATDLELQSMTESLLETDL